jgi:hypothetical protein
VRFELSELDPDDLIPEYRLDYRKAKPNRFATERGKAMGTRKVVRSAKTGRFVKPSAAKKSPSTTVTETVRTSPKKKKK